MTRAPVIESRESQGVQYLTARFFDSGGTEVGTARFQAYTLKDSLSYPTEPLDCSDLWLVQESLDAYLEHQRGRVGWLDCLERSRPRGAEEPSLMSLLAEAWPLIHYRLGEPEQTLFYPYPIGVADEGEALAIQAKMQLAYILEAKAVEVPGTPFLRMPAV